MTKKMLALLLALSMILALAACGGPTQGNNDPTSNPTSNPGSDPTQSVADGNVQEEIANMAETAGWSETAVNSGILETITAFVDVDKNYTIRIGTPTAVGEQNYTIELFEAYMEAVTKGKIQVELFPSGQLGTNPQMVQNVLDGSLSGVCLPIDFLAGYAPAANITNVPYLFSGSFQATRIFNSTSYMTDYLAGCGFWAAGYLYEHTNMIIADRAIESMGDFKGVKCFAQGPMTIAALEALGATPTSVDLSEMALSMQTGVINAASAGISIFAGQNLQDNAGYVNKLYTKPIVAGLFFGEEFKDSLPGSVVDLINQAAQLVVNEYEYNYIKERLVASADTVLAKAKLVIPSAEFEAEMEEALSGIVGMYLGLDDACQDMYDAMTAEIAADNAAGGEVFDW